MRESLRSDDDRLAAASDLLRRLVEAFEADVQQRAKPTGRWERWGKRLAVVATAAGLIFALWNIHTSQDQFNTTTRRSQYADIVNGMASDSVAVQVSSIRRLVHYVMDPENFDGRDDEELEAAKNAAQTLAAFIEDESSKPGHEGLTDYRNPQPIVVSRAMSQLVALTGTTPDDHHHRHYPQVPIDLSHGNFHGVTAPDFSPQGSFLARAADFRAATVTGWDLRAVKQPKLGSAFFTCADLQTSKLGSADVAGTDFTGANLRGADLSHVRNLTQAQLLGALTGKQTKLPSGIKPPPQPGWGYRYDKAGNLYQLTPACRYLIDRMTDVLPGSGFSTRLNCSGQSDWPILLKRSEQEALDRVCRLRTQLSRVTGLNTMTRARG